MSNIEALKQLRRVVEAAPAELFHMRSLREEALCGTAYCAAGWASLDPWFREHGFVGKGGDDAVILVGLDGRLTMRWSASALFFGITEYDTTGLFGGNLNPHGPPHSVSQAAVVANIDRLLAGKPVQYYGWESLPS